MAIELKIGLDVISSYKRLAYNPWHALAEFVDNSTQSYFDHRKELDSVFSREKEKLCVSIIYEKDKDVLRVSDNAFGMSYSELQAALHVARPPANTSGRSRYGMGMKTAACWIGNKWTIKTKQLNEIVEHKVTIDVDTISKGQNTLPYEEIPNKHKDQHYTVVEIINHNRKFHGRTLGKIRDYLCSMYREDFRNDLLILEWQANQLSWKDIDERLLADPEGKQYKKNFNFTVNGKIVQGWVGILDRGGRADAGFSIIHCGRVIRGWPESWRPTTLYGQIQGSNDLVNQRLVGEVHLDGFDVSHTKDDILWLGDEQDVVEDKLSEHCSDYREIAKWRRKRSDDERGPSTVETDAAIDELKKELESPEMVDQISIDVVPPKEAVDESLGKIKESVRQSPPSSLVHVGELIVKLYVSSDMSPNDPYVVTEAADEVMVIVNQSHPHWSQIKGSEGVLNYLSIVHTMPLPNGKLDPKHPGLTPIP